MNPFQFPFFRYRQAIFSATLSLSLLLISLNSQLLAQQNLQATGRVNVLAVMVEFQEDDNEFTSGNGTFGEGSLPYMEDPEIKIDPLPHNRDHFEAHLQFLRNWYRRASNNQLDVVTHLLPTVYQLDNEMAHYSPTGEEFDFRQLAELVRDTWTKVDQGPALELPFDVDGQTALLIFHAGVGRDIELIGTILDKTYQDIPSIYMSERALSEFEEVLDPDTFRIKNGRIPITNSLIIPRTLSRRGEIFEEEQVISFSINGLMVASLASHLGLPDLFNTDNGQSGIGRFGLMDGAGFILSYNGLFPPLPSAWERIKLGWDSPTLINGQEGTLLQLPAVELGQPNSILKYEISNSEYFLFENRHRDPDADGVLLTYRSPDGSIQQQRFTNIDTTFSGQFADFDSLLTRGVLIDVDQLDFALPGGLDPGLDRRVGTPDDRELNGGILIWHVDESVIEAQPNAINANEDRRGIDLEEADGAQDIGKPIPNSLVDLSAGHAFDFWWDGNDYRVISEIDTQRVYQNRFGLDTRPNSNNNGGGSTYFEAFDFSPNQAIASFRFRSTQDDFFTNQESFFAPQTASTFSYIERSATLPPAFFSRSINNTSFVTGFSANTIFLTQADDPSLKWTLELEEQILQVYPVTLSSTDIYPSIAVISQQDASENNWVFRLYETGSNNDFELVWERAGFTQPAPKRVFAQKGNILQDQFGEYSFDLVNRQFTYRSSIESIRVAVDQTTTLEFVLSDLVNLGIDLSKVIGLKGLGKASDFMSAAIIQTDGIYMLSQDGQLIKQIPISEGTYPAFGDLNNDQSTDMVVTTKQEGTNQVSAIVGYQANGAQIDGFPISLEAYNLRAIGPLQLIQSDEDNTFKLLFEATDELSLFLMGLSVDTGVILPSFPRSLGRYDEGTSERLRPYPLLIDQSGTYIYADSKGRVKLADLSASYKTWWAAAYGNTVSSFFESLESQQDEEQASASILVQEETYNWPNPAQDQTVLRYQSVKGATIDVLIAQPSGRTVYKTKVTAQSDLPEDLIIGLQDWPSGVYLARIQAEFEGQSARKIIKIAVVK